MSIFHREVVRYNVTIQLNILEYCIQQRLNGQYLVTLLVKVLLFVLT